MSPCQDHKDKDRPANQPAGNVALNGKERSEKKETQKDQVKRKGSIPLFSINWWLSVLRSQDLSCFSSFFLFFF